MEVKGAGLLYTLATLSVTFAGFAALLLMLRQSAGAGLSALDRFLARTVVGHYFWLAVGAIFPSVLSLYELPAQWVWRTSALLFGLPMLWLLLTYQRRRVAATRKAAPPRIIVTFIGLGSLSVLVMIGYIFANLANPAAAYASAITVNFVTHGYAVVTALDVILSQQAGADTQG
jgi:hypothetical protein